ncbi:hypothetical protein D9757_003315 [Collybiopsis confluens]|uniref:Zn(2)-C6 fungal-type domain-containing protein n=1 Tax=Collybiopsis confluens TaxID=2823264 RepID=A0A8H5MFG9_9AGAR|nr:hypothetical protein D9757_003315 [Collybiopsis confluens]
MVSNSPAESRDAGSRSSLACDACRRRKIKCDSTERAPGKPCSKCEAADLECKFTYTRKKRRPNLAPKSRKYGIETAQILVEHIVSALEEYSIPQDSESVREILISLAKYARSLEQRLNQSSQSNKSGSTTDSTLVLSPESNKQRSPELDDEEDDSEEEVQDIAVDFKNLSLGGTERHFGRSSNYLFLHTAIEYRPEHPSNQKNYMVIRPEMWSTEIWKWVPEYKPPVYTFPENDLLRDLIDIFFEEISPYTLPLLHRPTFENAVASGLHLSDQFFGATVLAVCALAARNSNDPRNLIEVTEYEQLAGWKWLRQIQLVRPSFEITTSVYELQLYCLATFYLSSTTISDSSFPLIGLGIRLAHERGAHRARRPGQAQTKESELWVRAFWCLVGLDIMGGLTFGRPPMTTPNDFDVEPIAECDDEEWTSLTPFVQPAGKPSKTSFGVYYHRLMQIAGSIQRSIYAVRRADSDSSVSKPMHGTGASSIEWNQREVMKHDSALNEWLGSLPLHLRWDPHRTDSIFLGQTVILHSTFYWVQITLHKKFVMRIAPAAPGISSISSSDSAISSPEAPEMFAGTCGVDTCAQPESSRASRSRSRDRNSTSNINSKNRTLASLEMRMSFPSLAVCTNAARCSVNIAQAYHQRDLHPIPDILPLLGNTASVLMVSLWRSKHSSTSMGAAPSRREWGDLLKTFAIMAGYERRHQWAGRLIDKFMALAKAEGLDGPMEAPPHSHGLKRNRPDDGGDLDLGVVNLGRDTTSLTDWMSTSTIIPPPPSLLQSRLPSTLSSLSQTSVPSLSTSTSTWTPFYPTSTTFGLPSSSSASASHPSSSALLSSTGFAASILDSSGGSLHTGEGSSSISNMRLNGGLFGDGPDISSFGGSASQQGHTRPIDSSDLGNGIFDEMADVYQLAGEASSLNVVGSSDAGGGNHNNSFGHIDLEDWNMFMRNVDDALFEAGLGR